MLIAIVSNLYLRRNNIYNSSLLSSHESTYFVILHTRFRLIEQRDRSNAMGLNDTCLDTHT